MKKTYNTCWVKTSVFKLIFFSNVSLSNFYQSRQAFVLKEKNILVLPSQFSRHEGVETFWTGRSLQHALLAFVEADCREKLELHLLVSLQSFLFKRGQHESISIKQFHKS